MTTPGRKPREQRRAELLDDARAVFIGSGYHAASMDDIADHAGVSKPVLYQYFAGKLYLYLAVLDAAIERLTSAVDVALGAATTPHARVGAIIETFFAFVADPQGDFALIFGSDLVNDPEVRQRVQRLDAALTRRIGETLSADADVSSADAELTAAGLLGLARGSAWHWRSTLDHRPPATQAAALVTDLAWHGLRQWHPGATTAPAPAPAPAPRS